MEKNLKDLRWEFCIQNYQTYKKEVIDPYISIKNNEARIGLRVMDSKEDLRRNELLKKIDYDLRNGN